MARSDIKNDSTDLSKLPEHKRKAIEMNQLNADGKKNNQTVNKARQSYMAQENVKEFNKEFMPKALLGRPCRWSSVEEVGSDISDYLSLCEKTNTVPTITSLSAWLHCSRDTIYSHANNPRSIFSDVMKSVINICHSYLENGAVDGKVNAVLYMFMSKNYFGLKDDKNITVTPSNPDQPNSQATMDAIKKQIQEENTPNADYVEKS